MGQLVNLRTEKYPQASSRKFRSRFAAAAETETGVHSPSAGAYMVPYYGLKGMKVSGPLEFAELMSQGFFPEKATVKLLTIDPTSRRTQTIKRREK